MGFPININNYRTLRFGLSGMLTEDQEFQLKKNIDLVRDTVVFMTALSGAKGLSGHTGGAYDIVPELLIADSFRNGCEEVYPTIFDEAGHRVAVHYIMSALNDHIPIEKLLHYREFDSQLPGHPELGITPCIMFSSGRLGHLWSFVNGIAMANPDRRLVMLSSDGSLQEGNDAEAARFAVANRLEVKVLVDDNDVTISGHPSEYLQGFDLEKTLSGHGLAVSVGEGEAIKSLYSRIQNALNTTGPVAVINKRIMAPCITGLEGKPNAHEAIPVELAIDYLGKRGHDEAVEMLRRATRQISNTVYLGSSKETGKNRDEFGKVVCSILGKMSPEDRRQKVLVVDNDLEGSCGLHHIGKRFPDVYIRGGVMERNNFSVAAGFGSIEGRQGIYGTFSAFLEMIISEMTMARLNNANVLAHLSHAGVDDIADNTCHFGINNFFADNGFSGDKTRLYFPADSNQMRAVVETIFYDEGLRFVFSTRSHVPSILKENGEYFFDPKKGYRFEPGKDEVIREASLGYVVSYGEMLYRCLDAVDMLRNEGVDVGLVNKPTLNVVDEEMMEMVGRAPFVLLVESQNYNTGLGSRFGTWLLERGYTPRYRHLGVVRHGNGGLNEQIAYQGLAPEHIKQEILSLTI